MPPICQDYQKREWRGGGGNPTLHVKGGRRVPSMPCATCMDRTAAKLGAISPP